MSYQTVLEKGYLPVDFLVVGDSPVLRFQRYPATVFDEPFLDTACQNYRSVHGDGPSQLIKLSDCMVRDEGTSAGALQPRGFIFHMSRCGSTLISQMLNQMKDTRVLSEPELLNRLLKSELDQNQKDEILQCVLASYQEVAPRSSDGVICKFSSQATVYLMDIIRCYPHTPWIFVIRQPREVIASLLNYANSSQARRKSIVNRVKLVLDLNQSEITTYSLVDLVARMLGRMLDKAIAMVSKVRVLVVDYRELPGAVHSKIAPHFSLEPSQRERRLMFERSRYRAKGREKVPFSVAYEISGREDYPQIDQAASTWLDDSYLTLRKML